MLTSVEICTGAGGQALGLEQAGFEHLAVVENDRHACETLRANRPEWNVIEEDLLSWDPPDTKGWICWQEGCHALRSPKPAINWAQVTNEIFSLVPSSSSVH